MDTDMAPESLSSKVFNRVCCCVIFFIAASASFNGFYEKWHFHEPGVTLGGPNARGDKIGLQEMLDGTASRPFAYRPLVPDIANWLNRITPQSTKDTICNLATYQGKFIDSLGTPLVRNPLYVFRYLVVYTLTFLFAWLAVLAMCLVCRSYAFPSLVCVFAPALMILLIPYCMSLGGYFYDYPELAFFALAAWMALEFDWWWMLPLVALATWNKETFLPFTITLYPLLRTRTSRAGALLGTCMLFLTSTAVYWPIHVRFSANSGGAVEWNLLWFVGFLLHPVNWIKMEETYGTLAFMPCTVISLALIVWTVRIGWHRLPQQIKRHAQIAAAINFPLYFLFGMPGEVRNLSMLYVTLLLLFAVILATVNDKACAVGAST